MSNDPLSFLDEKETSSYDPLSFLDKPKRSSLEKKGRKAAQYALGAADTALFPLTLQSEVLSSRGAQHAEFRKNIFEDLERLAEQKATGVWDEQDEQLFQYLQDQIQHPENADPFVKTANISPSGLIKQGIKKASGYDLNPEGAGEHVAEVAGNLLSPKNAVNLIKYASKTLPKLATAESRKAFKLERQWKALDKSVKGNPTETEILDFAKAKNLTPQESTLLLQSDAKIKVLEKIAKKSKKFKGIVTGLEDKLGNSYEELKSLGKQGGYLKPQEVESLQNELGNVLSDIDKTFVEGPDTKAARELIEGTIKNLDNKAGTIEELINSRRNLRQFTNWNKLHEGDAIKSRAANSFLSAIERKNPQIAKELKKTDKAWAKYEQFEKLMKKHHISHWHGIPVPGLLGTLVFTAAGLMKGGIPGAAFAFGAKEVIQRISTRLLTDPKFQSIHTKMLQSIVSGSQKNQKGILTAFMKVLEKEDPELYEDFKESVIKSK